MQTVEITMRIKIGIFVAVTLLTLLLLGCNLAKTGNPYETTISNGRCTLKVSYYDTGGIINPADCGAYDMMQIVSTLGESCKSVIDNCDPKTHRMLAETNLVTEETSRYCKITGTMTIWCEPQGKAELISIEPNVIIISSKENFGNELADFLYVQSKT